MAHAPINNCTAAALFAAYKPLDVVFVAQAAFSLITLIIFACVIARTMSRRRKMPYHRNLKVLAMIASFFYITHSLAIVVQNIAYQVIRHRHTDDPCSYATVSWFCILQEFPVYASILGFTLAHLLLFLERCMATFMLEKYQNVGAKPLVFLLSVTAVVFTAWQYYIFGAEDLWTYRSHCSYTSQTNAGKLAHAVYVLLSLDIIAGVGDLVLVVINKRASQRKVANDYTLQKAYQLHENDVTLKLIFPLSAIHCGIYVVYLGTNTIIRTFFSDAENVITFITLLEADHILVCLYTSVPPLAFYAFLRRFEKSSQPVLKPPDETDIYFKQFEMLLDSSLRSSERRGSRLFSKRQNQVTPM